MQTTQRRNDDTSDDGLDQRRPQRRDSWRIDHQIPIAVIFTLLLQTGAGVWFFAGMSAKLDNAIKTLDEFKTERYTKTDAMKDRELMLTIIQTSQHKDVELERRLSIIERRVDVPVDRGLR